MASEKPQRKIFISYSHSSPDHIDAVVKLATRLMEDGVDVELDQWGLKEGHDLHHFMESMVRDPSFHRVLCICDCLYSKKADNREGGAGTEAQIITPELYDRAGAVKQDKFIPIIFEYDDEGKPCRPIFLKTRVYINMADADKYEESYEKLLRNIFDRPAMQKPALGVPPSYIIEEPELQIITVGKFRRVKESLMNNKNTVRGDLRDLIREYNKLLPPLTYRDKGPMSVELDELVLHTIDSFSAYRQQYAELIRLLADYGETSHFSDILQLFQDAAEEMYDYNKYPGYGSNWRIEALQFITRDLLLTTTAILIETDRLDELDILLDHIYFVNRGGHEEKQAYYTIFDSSFQTLDEHRKARLSLNRLSVTADEIKARSTLPGINFNDTMQADFILALRSVMHNYGSIWFSRSLVYAAGHSGRPFPVFARAVDPKRLNVLLRLLKVSDKAELRRRFEAAYSAHNLENWKWEWDRLKWKTLMSWDTLYPDDQSFSR